MVKIIWKRESDKKRRITRLCREWNREWNSKTEEAIANHNSKDKERVR